MHGTKSRKTANTTNYNRAHKLKPRIYLGAPKSRYSYFATLMDTPTDIYEPINRMSMHYNINTMLECEVMA